MAFPSNNLSSGQTEEECPFLDNLDWNESFLTKDVLAGLVALISINTITAILTVLLNALVILAVVRNPQMRSNSEILLACLAGNDLLTGLLVLPLQIAREARHVLGTGPFCDVDSVSVLAVIFSCSTSLYHVALVTFSRYVAIKFPLQYRSVMTRRRLICGVLAVWAVPLAYTIVPGAFAIFGGKILSDFVFYVDKAIAFSVLFSLVGIIYMNAAILVESRRYRKRLERLQNELTRQEETRKFKRKDRVAKTVAIVVSVLILSYFPALTLFSFREIARKLFHARVLNVICFAAMTLVLLTSFLNPIIYCWRIKKFRDAFFEMLPSWHSQTDKSVEDIEMQCQYPTFHPSSYADLPLPTVEQEPVLLSFSNLNTADSALQVE